MQRTGVGWKYNQTSATLGHEFVNALSKLLWMLTDQWVKFSENGCTLPEELCVYRDRLDAKGQKKSLVSRCNVLPLIRRFYRYVSWI